MPSAARRLCERLAKVLAVDRPLDEQVAAADAIVRSTLGADFAAWSTVDPATTLSTSCAVFGDLGGSSPLARDERERERRVFELEWDDRDPVTFAALVREQRLAGSLRREVTDVGRVRRYRELLRPLGLTDDLRLRFVADGLDWGTVILYRRRPEPFGPREVEMAAAASKLLAHGFRRAMLQRACLGGGLVDPPGALLVGIDGAVITTSAAAEALLSTLEEHHVATILVNLVTRTGIAGTAAARVAGREGMIALHASPAKGVDGAISVVVERLRAVQLAPLIMAAIGLTPREREVVERALAGYSRQQIARRLNVSADTVGDHLTSAYGKAGVGNRAELSAMLFGEFYDETRDRHIPPSPYGYFLTPESQPIARA
jgi:DNA-binding CsgD family transcriptional regulator